MSPLFVPFVHLDHGCNDKCSGDIHWLGFVDGDPRPTGTELAAMTDAEFAAFVAQPEPVEEPVSEAPDALTVEKED